MFRTNMVHRSVLALVNSHLMLLDLIFHLQVDHVEEQVCARVRQILSKCHFSYLVCVLSNEARLHDLELLLAVRLVKHFVDPAANTIK